MALLTFSSDLPAVVRIKKADRGFAPATLPVAVRPSSFGIAERLYAQVKAGREDRVQTRVYASGLKNCQRQQVFGLLGCTPIESSLQQDNPQWAVSAEIGTAIHERIEKWLTASGILVQSEFRVTSPDDTLSGRVDAHIRVSGGETAAQKAEREIQELFPLDSDTAFEAVVTANSRDAILDVKTIGEKDFNEGAWGQKIEGYIAQISVYGRLLGIDTGIILLVNRNNGSMLDLEFTIDPVYADRMLARATAIYDAAKRRELPLAEKWVGPDGSFECKAFCGFYALCAKEQRTGEVSAALLAGEVVN